ncbi:ABC-three component system protein [Neorhizobium sp. P12A]|uniref:ABC-three component system protein n=1 Tax=Neorhizobium sp. P12A TaxID=2268027 RepID=UPI0011ED7E6A|nr:ABC-three component system protein [Neorhizobium sp. P12A]
MLEYRQWQRWGETGDLGRDVVGYVTDNRHEGPWDNFQCKQLKKRLSLGNAFLELGKIFKHSADGAYSLPRRYTFVAPRGVARGVQELVSHPEAFRTAVIQRWDELIARRLVEKTTIPLSTEIKAKIDEFDFKNIDWLDAEKLVADPYCLRVLVGWFDADPGRAPRGSVPTDLQATESVYVSQLLHIYAERSRQTFRDSSDALSHPDHGDHFRDQRIRFFDAMEFERFYRDSTPLDYVDTFKHEVYSGVIDTHRRQHKDCLGRAEHLLDSPINVSRELRRFSPKRRRQVPGAIK